LVPTGKSGPGKDFTQFAALLSAQHEYLYDVVMTCSGCSGAVTRVLSKLDGECDQTCRLSANGLMLITNAMTGVDSFDVSLEKQQVVVKGSASYDTVLEKIKKTGKEVKNGTVIS
jgi:copper chaperone